MLNKAMLSPRNIIVIGLMTLAAHFVARPLYNIVDKKDEQ